MTPKSIGPRFGLCRGISSNSESFALKTKRRPKFGMQFSPHEPRNILERVVLLIPKVCTRALMRSPER